MNLSSARFLLMLFAGLAVASCVHLHSGTVQRPAGSARWTNSLSMVFVRVPGTEVKFPIYETRVKDFAAFAATNPRLDGTNWNHALFHGVTPVSDEPDFPVVNVSWNDATNFCAWLAEHEHKAGVISDKELYRLPTDAEWSFAAGIGDRETGATPKEKGGKLVGVYPWGTEFPPPAGAGNFADAAALNYFTNWPHIEGYNDGFVTTAPVGSFRPNQFGIYDLAGNAAEWCMDYYDGSQKQRVLRGGAWINCGPRSLLSSYREHVGQGRFSVATGFRCVLATNL